MESERQDIDGRPSSAKRPVIGITMGDPAGIGAEIVVRALAHLGTVPASPNGGFAEASPAVTGLYSSVTTTGTGTSPNDGSEPVPPAEPVPTDSRLARFIIFGMYEQLQYTADQLELDLPMTRVHHEEIANEHPQANNAWGWHRGDILVADYDELDLPSSLPRGPSKPGGVASMAFCEGAIDAAKRGIIDAIVTAPLSKTSWGMAGYKQYPGHTELLADKFKARHVAMMFVAPQLKVVLATIHEAIIELRDVLSIGRVFDPIELADRALRDWFGIEKPRIAVCGLNPHAGEDGRFGDEESRIITPAILMAGEAGINVSGPYPADTVYLKALDGKFDCVVAMYHDQGLIPIKLLAWRDAVNLTLGLPIIRTSPDHGTAFDIAGKYKADPASMIAALKLAIDLSHRRR